MDADVGIDSSFYFYPGDGITYEVDSGNITITNNAPFPAASATKLSNIAENATANAGTITGVTGGTGLSGSGISGAVTLDADVFVGG